MFFNISRIRIRRCCTIYKALETRLVLVIQHQIILLMHVNVQCEKSKTTRLLKRGIFPHKLVIRFMVIMKTHCRSQYLFRDYSELMSTVRCHNQFSVITGLIVMDVYDFKIKSDKENHSSLCQIIRWWFLGTPPLCHMIPFSFFAHFKTEYT